MMHASKILAEFEQAQAELVGKAVVLTDGKARDRGACVARRVARAAPLYPRPRRQVTRLHHQVRAASRTGLGLIDSRLIHRALHEGRALRYHAQVRVSLHPARGDEIHVHNDGPGLALPCGQNRRRNRTRSRFFLADHGVYQSVCDTIENSPI
jgi:hypothetical protein